MLKGNVILIDNYDSFTYNVAQYIEVLGFRCVVIRNDAISTSELRKLRPSHIVISPGPGDPDSAGISLEVIKVCGPDTPLLGVCLGHQAIGQAFGGRVIRAKRPQHGKVSKVLDTKKSDLYKGMKKPFLAARYHSLVIERASLPHCLEVTSQTSDGIIMGVRHKKFLVEGVQFHPESIATQGGLQLMRNFLHRRVQND